jgi:hypothetical protein
MEPGSSNPTNSHRRRPINSRPYRSKRHPPCNECRRKKLRCQADGHLSCQRCLTSGYPCSFAISLHQRYGAALPRSNSSATRQVATVDSTQVEVVSAVQQPQAERHAVNLPSNDFPALNHETFLQVLSMLTCTRHIRRIPSPRDIRTKQFKHLMDWGIFVSGYWCIGGV